jgi:predicted MPP superfamily phosphohydrolase
VALQLSGHTHAGQVFPASLLGRLVPTGDVFYGHKLVGGCHVVVSSGLGCRGSRLRSGSRAEFVVLDLVNEAE